MNLKTKYFQIFLTGFLLLIGSSALALGPGDQGYGVMLGNPSGVSAKFWFKNDWAVDGAVGIARGEFDIHASLLKHDYDWTETTGGFGRMFSGLTTSGDLPFYFGVGPRLLFEHNKEFGIRFPVGVSYIRKAQLWDVFVEFAPVVRITPDFGFNGDYAIGIRYYFEAIKPKLAG